MENTQSYLANHGKIVVVSTPIKAIQYFYIFFSILIHVYHVISCVHASLVSRPQVYQQLKYTWKSVCLRN